MEHNKKDLSSSKIDLCNFNVLINSQNLIVHHHWVHRRRQEGKCKLCGKVTRNLFNCIKFIDRVMTVSCGNIHRRRKKERKVGRPTVIFLQPVFSRSKLFVQVLIQSTKLRSKISKSKTFNKFTVVHFIYIVLICVTFRANQTLFPSQSREPQYGYRLVFE